MSILENSSNLFAKFEILLKNDMMLKRKIRSLDINQSLIRKYQRNILNYFNEVGGIEEKNYDEIRAQKTTKYMKAIWQEVHRKIETSKLFSNFEKFEQFLFKIPRYRGHYIHQFNVFILGFYILKKLLENPNISRQIQSNNDNPYFTWMACSTSHDLGYPIQEVETWFQDFLEDFLGATSTYHIDIKDILTPTYPNYIGYFSEIHYQLVNLNQNQWNFSEQKHKDMQFEELLLRKLDKKDHGVLSAIILAYSVLIKETSLDQNILINRDFPRYILPACHAIAVHNFDPDDLIIEFEKTPFAFLLVLCDELQDWGRSQAKKDKSDLLNVEINQAEIPEIIFNIKMLDVSKKESFDLLKKKLRCNLIKIIINSEYQDQIYRYIINNEVNDEDRETSIT